MKSKKNIWYINGKEYCDNYYSYKKRKEGILVSVAIIFAFTFIYFICGLTYDKGIYTETNEDIAVNISAADFKFTDEEYVAEEQKNVVNLIIGNYLKGIEENELSAIRVIIQNGQVVASERDKEQGQKVAYLTFDDGPSQNTVKILDILKQNNIKATFFVIGSMVKNNENIVRREVLEGHSVGNHTYSHDYKYVYSSPDIFLKDLKKNEDLLKSVLGNYTFNIIRFPGGSFGLRKEFKDVLAVNNYRYVDWNSLNGDAEANNLSKETLINRFKSTALDQKTLLVLMHDAPNKYSTVEALPEIIRYLKERGYDMRSLK